MFLFTVNWGLHQFKLNFSKEVGQACKRTCCLTRVEQNDSFEADELLGFEPQRAETRRGGKQHVEYLGHSLNTIALIPGENWIGFKFHNHIFVMILWPFFHSEYTFVFWGKKPFKKVLQTNTSSISVNKNGRQRKRCPPIGCGINLSFWKRGERHVHH